MADDACACAYSSCLTTHKDDISTNKRFCSALACAAAYLVVKGCILNIKLDDNDLTNSDLKK